MYILLTVLHVSFGTAWENFFKHQGILSVRIISLILLTCTFDLAVILLGEICCWSLLGLEGSVKCQQCHFKSLLLKKLLNDERIGWETLSVRIVTPWLSRTLHVVKIPP